MKLSEDHYFRAEFFLLGAVFLLVTAVFVPAAYLLSIEPRLAIVVLLLLFALLLVFALFFSYLHRLRTSTYHEQLQELLNWIEADRRGNPPELTGEFSLLAEKIDNKLKSLNSKSERLENYTERLESIKKNVRRRRHEFLEDLSAARSRLENVEEAVLAYLRRYDELESDLKSIQQNSKKMHTDLSELFALVSEVLSRRQHLLAQVQELITALEGLEKICSRAASREEQTVIDEINDLLGKSRDLQELVKNLQLETKRGKTPDGVNELVGQLYNELSELPAVVEKLKEMIAEHEEELSERRRQVEEKLEDLEIKIATNRADSVEEINDKLGELSEKLEEASAGQRKDFEQIEETLQSASEMSTDFTGEFCRLDAALDTVVEELKEKIQEDVSD